MKSSILNDIKEALEILGLSSIATKDQIIERTKKLKAVYEDSESVEDMAKLSKIYQASQIVLENFEYLSQINSINEDPNNNVSNIETFPPKKNKRKLNLILISIFLVIILGISIPLGIIISRQNTYHKLEELMMNVANINDIRMIGFEIDKLPYEYRDIQEIKEVYQIIRSEMFKIYEGKLMEDYESMRIAYYNLVLLDNTNFNWDLSDYLESVDNRILLLNIYWYNVRDEFHLYINQSTNKIFLQTNLPNDKKSGTNYYYYTENNFTIIGYENQADATDKFEAFKIVSIKENEIKIYSFRTNQTYTLTRRVN